MANYIWSVKHTVICQVAHTITFIARSTFQLMQIFRIGDDFFLHVLLHCALSIAVQCIVIGPVCGGRKDGRTAGGRAVSVTTITQNCVHRSTGSVGAGSDHPQLIKFWRSCAPGKGVCGGAKIFGAQCLRLSERFFHFILFFCVTVLIVLSCMYVHY